VADISRPRKNGVLFSHPRGQERGLRPSSEEVVAEAARLASPTNDVTAPQEFDNLRYRTKCDKVRVQPQTSVMKDETYTSVVGAEGGGSKPMPSAWVELRKPIKD
jgi:hypothetical protein